MKGLTAKQKNILEFIDKFQRHEGMAPTVYEIADHFGIKTSTVFAHIRALQRKNYLTRSNKARSIALTGFENGEFTANSSGAIPVFSAFGSGSPVNGCHVKAAELVTDAALVGNSRRENLFAVYAVDDSMRDLGILEEDVLIAEYDANVRSGDIVVVVLDGATSVKSYFPLSNGTVELRPANPDFTTEVHSRDDVRIMGKVVGLHRQY